MSVLSFDEALENIYTSVRNDNEDIDLHIANLKKAMANENKKSIDIDTSRLVYNNRHGKKLMKSYFKKRGVTVNFIEN